MQRHLIFYYAFLQSRRIHRRGFAVDIAEELIIFHTRRKVFFSFSFSFFHNERKKDIEANNWFILAWQQFTELRVQCAKEKHDKTFFIPLGLSQLSSSLFHNRSITLSTHEKQKNRKKKIRKSQEIEPIQCNGIRFFCTHHFNSLHACNAIRCVCTDQKTIFFLVDSVLNASVYTVAAHWTAYYYILITKCLTCFFFFNRLHSKSRLSFMRKCAFLGVRCSGNRCVPSDFYCHDKLKTKTTTSSKTNNHTFSVNEEPLQLQAPLNVF